MSDNIQDSKAMIIKSQFDEDMDSLLDSYGEYFITKVAWCMDEWARICSGPTQTSVAIPEIEKVVIGWAQSDARIGSDHHWYYKEGAIAMYRKMQEEVAIWQHAFNSIRIERNDYRYQWETSQMKEAAANAQIEAIQKEVARMTAIADDFGRIIKERDLEIFALNSRIEGLNSVIDHLHKH